MTLDSSGWFDWAWRFPLDLRLIRDGGKVIENRPTSMEGICGHSLEGWVSVNDNIRTLLGKGPSGCTPAERGAVMNALERIYWAFRDPSRTSTGWHATNILGVSALIQHAPWHARLAHGNAFNVRGPGLEHEGTAANGEIDAHQVATSLRITRDTEAAYGRKFPWTEHRRWGPTACPSERLAPLHAALAKGGNEVTREEYDELVRDIWGRPERRAELKTSGVTSLEGRIDRLERADGPIGTRLSSIETEAKRQATELARHTAAPHTADGIRDDVIAAFTAGAATMNGEQP